MFFVTSLFGNVNLERALLNGKSRTVLRSNVSIMRNTLTLDLANRLIHCLYGVPGSSLATYGYDDIGLDTRRSNNVAFNVSYSLRLVDILTVGDVR